MGRLRFLLLAATVGSAPVLAEPAYPFGVTLTIRPEAMRASVMHEPGWVSSPSNPSGTVEVGKQASDAWGALVARRFAAGPPPTAEIEVLAVHASLEPDGDVWDAVVEHEVVFRAAGNELGHWNLQASAAVNGLGQAAIPRAFALAADRAARSFEAQFAQAGGVREWLAQRKITVIPVAPPAIADMPRVARSVPRSPFGFYVDVGLLDAESSSTLTTTGAGTRDSAANGFSLALRTGFSLRWALIQFAATKWSFSSALLNGDVDATALGIDVAPALRLGPVELVAGVGLQWINIDLTPFPFFSAGSSTSLVTPSGILAIRYAAPIFGGKAHLRFSAEARSYFGSAADMGSPGAIANRQVSPGSAFALLLGVELPVRR